MSRIKRNKTNRTREVIKATKASRVPGFTPNILEGYSNRKAKKQARALSGKVQPQGVNPRKKYAYTRKNVNMVSHNQTGVVSSVIQLRVSTQV